jgi:hypothetical protein
MMRIPTKSALIIQVLAAVQIGVSANLFSAEKDLQVTHNMSDQKQWVCDYTRAANDVLYLRCEDKLSLLEDPLIMQENEKSATQYIPIWRRPSNDRSAIKLVESVLCNQDSHCSVGMRSLPEPARYANR